MNQPATLSLALYSIEIAVTVSFSLFGIVEAARRKLDAVGVCVVAGLAAFGGGTLRDVLLDRRPFFWVEHAELLWLVKVIVQVENRVWDLCRQMGLDGFHQQGGLDRLGQVAHSTSL